MITKLIKLFHTLRYLKAAQLLFFFLRRFLPARKVEVRPGLVCRRLQLPDLPIATSHSEFGICEFSFLNERLKLADDPQQMDWSPAAASRLWRYNLHYFDYLRDPRRNREENLALIDSWITKNIQGSVPGWEPFTVSLRIVNWIQYALLHCEEEQALKFQASLFEQALWLEKNDERHILANHYFENLKALFFAGCYLQGEEAERWLVRSKKEIIEQLEEQILADGGHYERSPQYHSLMLENLLDIYALAASNAGLVKGSFTSEVKKYAVRALDYLNTICFPTGAIPLFNDSAFGIAPTLAELNEYASRLFDYEYSEPEAKKIELNDSGMYGLRSGTDMILMDCGDIGPDYQPGHTHCDFLSYELMLDNKMLVVDSGTFEYSGGEMRDYVRSTRAHNTVTVDNGEQSELWAEFRVARRARKRFGQAGLADEKAFISGVYRGFFGGSLVDGLRSSPRIEHRRDICVKLFKDSFSEIDVVDTLEGKGECLAESYIHIHPDYEVKEIKKGLLEIITTHSGPVASIIIPEHCHCKVIDSWYCPEFGVRKRNHCVVIYKTTMMPLELAYKIQRKN